MGKTPNCIGPEQFSAVTHSLPLNISFPIAPLPILPSPRQPGPPGEKVTCPTILGGPLLRTISPDRFRVFSRDRRPRPKARKGESARKESRPHPSIPTETNQSIRSPRTAGNKSKLERKKSQQRLSPDPMSRRQLQLAAGVTKIAAKKGRLPVGLAVATSSLKIAW